MDELLPHYEYELSLLARGLTEFAGRNPKIASRLGIRGSHADDPHVDRLTQTFAFMAARLDSRLGDSYTEMTEALLSVIYPLYLRGVPSCAIARFNPATLFGQLTRPLMVPRDTSLEARAAPCRFRTVYGVTLAPLRIQAARYAPATLAPSAARLPSDATGILSVTFAPASVSGRFDPSTPSGPVRVHLYGERPVVAALTDAVLLRAAGAFVEADQNGRWLALSKVPVEAVGFMDDERLLPTTPGDPVLPFQYLLEYFAFPELFDFVDIDLDRIRRAARAPDARLLTLHVVLTDTPQDSTTAQMLGTIDAGTFQLFCTPVVNLFRRSATPIQLTSAITAYPVTPEALEGGPPLDLYSIDAVCLSERTGTETKDAGYGDQTHRTTVRPYRAFSHDPTSGDPDVYWLAFRDSEVALNGSRSLWLLSLIGMDGQNARPGYPQVVIDTTATNGELPSRLPIGNPLGDLLNEAMALACPISLLTRPTLCTELPRAEDALWRVLATLSPHPVDLTQSGLSTLKAFLRLHAPRSSMVAQRCIDALTGLGHQPTIRWMSLNSQFPSFVRGIEITLSFDEAALRDVTLSVFARTLDRFFRPYAPTNSYVQLVIRSAQTGNELLRCAAQPGVRPLV